MHGGARDRGHVTCHVTRTNNRVRPETGDIGAVITASRVGMATTGRWSVITRQAPTTGYLFLRLLCARLSLSLGLAYSPVHPATPRAISFNLRCTIFCYWSTVLLVAGQRCKDDHDDGLTETRKETAECRLQRQGNSGDSETFIHRFTC